MTHSPNPGDGEIWVAQPIPETGLTIRCQHRDCKWIACTMTFGSDKPEPDTEPVLRAYRDLAAQYTAHERERHGG